MRLAIRNLGAPVALAILSGCDAGSGSLADPTPQSPMPDVRLSLQFGPAPLDETVYLRPPPGSVNWSYAVDLDEDGVPDHTGRLTRELGFRFRFETPGVHHVRVELMGSDAETAVIERLAIAADPAAVHVMAEGKIGFPGIGYFEGIAVSPDGTEIYAGNFSDGIVYRVRAMDFAVVDSIVLGYGIEGLSVSPSGRYLMMGFKYSFPAVRLELPGLEPSPLEPNPNLYQSFFVHAVSDQLALFGGESRLELHDVATAQRLAVGRRSDGFEFETGHFDVTPGGDRVVVVDRSAQNVIRLMSLPDLQELVAIDVPGVEWLYDVAFDRSGDRFYVLAWSSEWEGLLAFDATTGAMLQRIRLDLECGGFCVANPTSRSRNGRLVAMESGGPIVIDTDIGLPIARFEGGSVAADPTADHTFYSLSVDGLIRRVRIDL
jgi:hypothetical protein